MKMINLTPHSITFITNEGNVVIEPSGSVARVSATTAQSGTVECDGITVPVTTTVYGEIEGLPEPQDDTIYLVSSLVASRTDRQDVFIPAESVRDEQGRIIGCKSLGRV